MIRDDQTWQVVLYSTRSEAREMNSEQVYLCTRERLSMGSLSRDTLMASDFEYCPAKLVPDLTGVCGPSATAPV